MAKLPASLDVCVLVSIAKLADKSKVVYFDASHLLHHSDTAVLNTLPSRELHCGKAIPLVAVVALSLPATTLNLSGVKLPYWTPWLIYTGNATLFNGGSLYNSKANTLSWPAIVNIL